jgi:hypothetical protein
MTNAKCFLWKQNNLKQIMQDEHVKLNLVLPWQNQEVGLKFKKEMSGVLYL